MFSHRKRYIKNTCSILLFITIGLSCSLAISDDNTMLYIKSGSPNVSYINIATSIATGQSQVVYEIELKDESGNLLTNPIGITCTNTDFWVSFSDNKIRKYDKYGNLQKIDGVSWYWTVSNRPDDIEYNGGSLEYCSSGEDKIYTISSNGIETDNGVIKRKLAVDGVATDTDEAYYTTRDYSQDNGDIPFAPTGISRYYIASESLNKICVRDPDIGPSFIYTLPYAPLWTVEHNTPAPVVGMVDVEDSSVPEGYVIYLSCTDGNIYKVRFKDQGAFHREAFVRMAIRDELPDRLDRYLWITGRAEAGRMQEVWGAVSTYTFRMVGEKVTPAENFIEAKALSKIRFSTEYERWDGERWLSAEGGFPIAPTTIGVCTFNEEWTPEEKYKNPDISSTLWQYVYDGRMSTRLMIADVTGVVPHSPFYFAGRYGDEGQTFPLSAPPRPEEPPVGYIREAQTVAVIDNDKTVWAFLTDDGSLEVLDQFTTSIPGGVPEAITVGIDVPEVEVKFIPFLEAPPNHVARLDFILPGSLYDNPVTLEVNGPYGTTFYKKNFSAPISVLPDTVLYTPDNLYDVSNLYNSSPWVRAVWDGRKDADGDGIIDKDGEGKDIYADLTKEYKSKVTIQIGDVDRFLGIYSIKIEEPQEGLGFVSNSGYIRNGVNATNGNIYIAEDDTGIKGGKSPQFTFNRSYNSQGWHYSTLGYGWTHNYNMKVLPFRRNGAREITLLLEDGRVLRFSYSSVNSRWETYLDGKLQVLNENTDGTWTLGRLGGTEYKFDETGKLTKITDRNGNQTNLSYNTYGYLQHVIDTTGRVIEFLYNDTLFTDNHLLKEVKTPDGKLINYTYSPDNQLINVEYPLPGVNTGYTYKEGYDEWERHIPGVLKQVTDAENHKTTYIYPDIYPLDEGFVPDDRATLNIEAKPGTYTKESGNYATNITYAEGITRVRDSYNNSTIYNHAGGRLTSIQDAQMGIESYTYDTAGNRTSIRDARGNTTTMTYDPRGNLVYLKDSLLNETFYEYDPVFDQLAKITDAGGTVTQNTIDPLNGNLLESREAYLTPDEAVTSYTYYTDGLVQSVTNPEGNTTTYGYDIWGNLFSIQTSLTDTELIHDIMGNLISETDPKGYTTTYQYDALNRLTKITHPNQSTTEYTYDKTGNRLSIKDPNGNYTYFNYDIAGRLKETYQAATNPITWLSQVILTTNIYDTEGNRTQVIDPNNIATNYQYDSLNRLFKEIYSNSTSTQYEYDAVGNRTKVTDASSNVTRYEYDNLNRLKKVILPPISGNPAPTTEYFYDEIGNLKLVTDANSHTTIYNYDRLSRLISTQDPLAEVTIQVYDKTGNLIQKNQPNGKNLTYVYDTLSRLKKITGTDGVIITYNYDPNSNLTQTIDVTGTTTNTYDNMNRLTKVEHTSGAVTQTAAEYEYDLAGNRTRMTDRFAKETTNTYDTANRLLRISTKDSPTSPIKRTTYTLNPVGMIEKKEYPDGSAQGYTFDNMNRISRQTSKDAGGMTIADTSYTYDGVGNIETETDYLTGVVTTYGYDTLNQLLSKTDTPGSSISYTYDSVGNRLIETTPTQTTTYVYDAGNRLLTAGSTTYSYDDNGNRLTKGSANYTYNSLNQLTQVTGLPVGTTTYTYDGQGRRVARTNDATIRYYYDGANPVAQVNEGDKLLRSYTWGAGLIGVTNKWGDTSYTTGDILGSTNTITVSEETKGGTASASSSLSGHPSVKAVDEKEGSYWDSGASASVSNPTTLTLKMSETVSIKGVAWVSKAIEHAALLYRIDTSTDNTNWTTLITGSTSTDPSPDLTFTPTNARYVKITVTQNNYTQTQQGNRTITEGWQVWEMWAVRTIPLTTTYSYKYDPYGNPTQTAPEKLNNFTYTGKEYDDETGLYYFGARYYDPEVGRWLTPDPIDGSYTYAFNNPIGFFDPNGLAPVSQHKRHEFESGIAEIEGDPRPLPPQAYTARDRMVNQMVIQTGLSIPILGPSLEYEIATVSGSGYERAMAAHRLFTDVMLIFALPLAERIPISIEFGHAGSTPATLAKSADTIAEGMRISPYRVTGPGESFIRYESGNPVFSRITPSGGVTPGTYAAPASEGIVPLAERPVVYNLPNPEIFRSSVIPLNPPPGTPIIGPRPVSGGTGNEVIFWMGY